MSSSVSETQKQALQELYALPWYRLIALFIVTILSGCASLQSAFMPTPVPCAPKDAPAKPQTLPDALLKKMDDYHLVLVIQHERLVLIDYAGKADAIIQACK